MLEADMLGRCFHNLPLMCSLELLLKLTDIHGNGERAVRQHLSRWWWNQWDEFQPICLSEM